jgi:lysophospholipase L1-like esterase
MTTALLAALTLTLMVSAASGADDASPPPDPVAWHDARTLTVEGRGWTDTAEFYNRLPAKAEPNVTKSVWGLSRDSAGMVVGFVTDSPDIHVKWKLISDNLAMPHMPATGVSGVDLYVRLNGKWRWLGAGRPSGLQNEAQLIGGLEPEQREYALYLPLYNGVTSVEVGVKDESSISPAPPRTRDIRPVVFYGSSILQGGCASRPGMAYPSIIGRRLDIPTINLGFSGAGKCEHEVADLLAELNPELYIIDCMPNMAPDTIDERIHYLVKVLREKHPDTPVILVEQVPSRSAFAMDKDSKTGTAKSQNLAKVYKDVAKDWGKLLHYVKGAGLLGDDGEGTVDGVHATDLGFQRMADALTPVVKRVLGSTPRSKP